LERVETARESVLTRHRRNRPLLNCHLELAESKQLLKHLMDRQVKRGSARTPLPDLSDAFRAVERCRTGARKSMARKWNEANCRSPRWAWFLQRLASPVGNRGRGNGNLLIRRELTERVTRTRWQRDCW